MSDKRPHINYSRSDIVRYLAGEMTPAEMHALEQAAHEDALLADAIEGYREADMHTASRHLEKIKTRLLNEQKDEVVMAPRLQTRSWLRVAAMLILVIGAAMLGWYILQPAADKGQLAQREVLPKDSTQSAQSPTPGQLPAPKLQEQQARMVPKEDHVPGRIANRSLATRATAAMPDAVSAPIPAAPPPEWEVIAMEKKQAADSAVKNAQTLADLRSRQARVSSSDVTGIGNLSGLAVTGVVSGGIYSGAVGSGREASVTRMGQPSAPAVTATVAAEVATRTLTAGLQPSTAAARPTGNVLVKESPLYKQSAPDGTIKSFGSVAIDSIMPVKGWQSFRNYLAEKMPVPLSWTRPVQLEISFDPKGRVIGVAVTRTWDTSLDPALIAAFKAGPLWLSAAGTPANGKKKITLLL